METEIISPMEIDNTKPYIKLIKNSKGYNWEIKILGADSSTVEQLALIDADLASRYGVTDG